nr:MAG TPA: hypothetical protein [Caudoviricetes sp.]
MTLTTQKFHTLCNFALSVQLSSCQIDTNSNLKEV